MGSPQVCNKIIKYSFYSLFILVPLVFWKETSELFELNKMWLTFALVVLIGTTWAVKSILTRKFYLQRTPLDIPIALFLLSQFVSTVVSLDTHISIWGYYSRFNGGLLSEVSYVFLYYAFLSNFEKTELLNMVQKILKLSIITGLIVALWGLPSHFGYDPTCLLFRGNLDVSCWTEDFQPKIRIFSTLGQPAWLGAYLALLIPLAIAMLLKIENLKLKIDKNFLLFTFYFLLLILFYIDLLYTKSRGAFIAVWASLIFFVLLNYKQEIFSLLTSRLKLLNSHLSIPLIIFAVFLMITFLIGTPFAQLRNFTLEGLQNNKPLESQGIPGTFSTGGGTDSGKIRLYVWRGALEIFKNYPLIGSGVETYAFAYYKFRPIEHNLTSEWNFLYNKAHNEYLNYLATTGIFGLGTYLLMIGLFLWLTTKKIWEMRNAKLETEVRSAKSHISYQNPPSHILLLTSLLTGYLTILITNFFGFSVVIINLYLFLIPAFVFVLARPLTPERSDGERTNLLNFNAATTFSLNIGKRVEKLGLAASFIVGLYFIFYLLSFWTADILYAFGSNLSRAGEYQQAYPYLKTASERVPSEPTFRDELAQTSATLAVALVSEGSSEAAKLAQDLARDAILATTFITQEHPNNLVFLKSQVRIYYTLSQIDDRYLSLALATVAKAQKLAPTDANISYNLGILYGQNKEYKKAVETLNKTVKLKPDYINAYYALGLFYHQLATNEKGVVLDFELQEKAIMQMKYILENLDPKNQLAKEALEAWQQELPSPSK